MQFLLTLLRALDQILHGLGISQFETRHDVELRGEPFERLFVLQQQFLERMLFLALVLQNRDLLREHRRMLHFVVGLIEQMRRQCSVVAIAPDLLFRFREIAPCRI